MIDYFLTQKAKIERLEKAVNETREYTKTVDTEVPCLVRPVSVELVSQGETFYSTATLYFKDDVDVEYGDILTVDGQKYNVQGVLNHNYGDEHVNHKQVGVVYADES